MNIPDNPSPAFRAQVVAPTLIALVAIAILQPFVVITTTSLPPHFDDPSWRLRVAALLLGSVPQMGVELAIIGAIGVFAGGWRALRGTAIVALLFAILLVPLLAFDALDVLQVRHIVPDDRQRGFDINAMQTLGLGALMVPALIWAGWRGIVASKRTAEQLVESTATGGRVVMQDGPTPAAKTIVPSR